jgi:hypothetical protein
VAVRAKIEGTCMLWLCHNNPSYRARALNLAHLVAHPALRKLERELKAPFLIDAICKYEQEDPFLPNIKDFLVHYREVCAVVSFQSNPIQSNPIQSNPCK